MQTVMSELGYHITNKKAEEQAMQRVSMRISMNMTPPHTHTCTDANASHTAAAARLGQLTLCDPWMASRGMTSPQSNAGLQLRTSRHGWPAGLMLHPESAMRAP